LYIFRIKMFLKIYEEAPVLVAGRFWFIKTKKAAGAAFFVYKVYSCCAHHRGVRPHQGLPV
jgi:hypothetical protein